MWSSKKYGALDVDHGSTQMQPALAKVKYRGGSVSALPIEISVVEPDVPQLYKLLDAIFEEGKRERSLEIQRALNGGNVNRTEHTILINTTDKRKD